MSHSQDPSKPVDTWQVELLPCDYATKVMANKLGTIWRLNKLTKLGSKIMVPTIQPLWMVSLCMVTIQGWHLTNGARSLDNCCFTICSKDKVRTAGKTHNHKQSHSVWHLWTVLHVCPWHHCWGIIEGASKARSWLALRSHFTCSNGCGELGCFTQVAL